MSKRVLKVLAAPLAVLIAYFMYFGYTKVYMGGYINPIDYFKSAKVEDNVIISKNILPNMYDADGNKLESIESYDKIFSYIGGDIVIYKGETIDRNNTKKLDEIAKEYSEEFGHYLKDIKLWSPNKKDIVTMKKNSYLPLNYILSVNNFELEDVYDIYINDEYSKSVKISFHFEYFYEHPSQHWMHGGEIEIVGNLVLAYYQQLYDVSGESTVSYDTDAIGKVVTIKSDKDAQLKRFKYECNKDNSECYLK